MWKPSHSRGLAVALTALALGTAALAVPTAPSALAAAPTAGLVVHYDMSKASGTTVPNSAASTFGPARLVNGAAADQAGGVVLDGTDDYVDLPDDILRGLGAITVSMDVVVDPGSPDGSWPWGLGNTGGDGLGSGYLFTTVGNYRTSISLGNYTAEQTVEKRSGTRRGARTTLTYTLDGSDVARLYEDGSQVASRTGVTIAPSAIGGGTTTENFLGRSLYRPDPYFKGVVTDFRVYDRALSAAEVSELATPVTDPMVAADRDQLDLGDTAAVRDDLVLPASGPAGSLVTWATSDASVVTADGRVTRPADGSAAATATLTATITRGSSSATRTFAVTVVPQRPAADRVADAAAALAQLPGLTTGPVRGSVTLPTTGLELADAVATTPTDGREVTITWSSSKPAVLSDTDTGSGSDVVAQGFLTRPATATDLTMTATVRLGDQSRTVTFPVTVPAAAPVADTDLQGYAFAYFTGDNVPGEKIRMAVSKGNDALTWQTLDNGAPILESTKGDQGLRDPFIMRSVEGDRFFMIATDLSVGRKGWGGATNRGSQHLEIWESTDLVNWGEQRHVKVSPDNFGMTWAPEAYWDETIGAYVVYWTSSTYTDATRDVAEGTNPKIYYATTRDFRTFTEPQLWLTAPQIPGSVDDRGLIDSTMIEADGTYYRFTKNTDASGCASADIVQQKSTRLRAAGDSGSWSVVSRCIARKAGLPEVEGPSVFKANPGDVNGGNRYYLWVDNYGGVGYIPLFTTSLDDPTWTRPSQFDLPASPRHGGVMPITEAERSRLVSATDPQALVTATEQVKAFAAAGATRATLPSTVKAVFADGHTDQVAVTWAAQDLSGLQAGDTRVLSGTLAGGQPVGASARITRLPSALAVTVSGTPAVGSSLTAGTSAGWTGATYSWLRNGVATGATGTTYAVTAADAGTTLSVSAQAVDPAGTRGRATSAGLAVPSPPAGEGAGNGPTTSATTTTVELPRKVRWSRKGVKVPVSVDASSGAVAQGRVRVTEKGKVLATATLAGGTVEVRLPRKLRPGKHTLVFTFVPAAGFATSSTTTTVRIKPAKKAGKAGRS